MTTLHAGGKFDNKTYQVSGGLHGVGVSVVNALSEWLNLEIKREGGVYTQSYKRGKPDFKLKKIGTTKKTGTKITFKPDPEIFTEMEYSFDTLSKRLRELSFLNKGLKISILDERTEKRHDFQYKGGIREFVQYLNQNKTPLNPKPIYFETVKGRCDRGDRASVQHRIFRNDLFFCQQYQHHRRRDSSRRIQSRLDPIHQQLCQFQQSDQRPEVQSGRGRYTGRIVRRHQPQNSKSSIRRSDQNQTGKQRGQRHRGFHRQ